MSVPKTNQHKKQKAGTRKADERKQDSANRSCHFTDPNRNRPTATLVMFCVDCAVGGSDPYLCTRLTSQSK